MEYLYFQRRKKLRKWSIKRSSRREPVKVFEKAKKDAHQRDVTRFVQCQISLIINSKGNYNG